MLNPNIKRCPKRMSKIMASIITLQCCPPMTARLQGESELPTVNDQVATQNGPWDMHCPFIAPVRHFSLELLRHNLYGLRAARGPARWNLAALTSNFLELTSNVSGNECPDTFRGSSTTLDGFGSTVKLDSGRINKFASSPPTV